MKSSLERMKQCRARPVPVKRFESEKWMEFHGNLPQGANSATGVSVCLRKRWFNKKNIVQVSFPPKQLQGWLLAVRIQRGLVDLLIGAVYMLLSDKMHNKQSYHAFNWLRQLLNNTPARCTPVLAGDWNGRCGKCLDAHGEWTTFFSTTSRKTTLSGWSTRLVTAVAVQVHIGKVANQSVGWITFWYQYALQRISQTQWL